MKRAAAVLMIALMLIGATGVLAGPQEEPPRPAPGPGSAPNSGDGVPDGSGFDGNPPYDGDPPASDDGEDA